VTRPGAGRGLGWGVLGGLLLLALAVRLVWIVADPLWIDEAATLAIASMSWQVIWGPMAAAESSPPGYYALAKLWGGVFGADIVAVRMLSVMAGVAALLPLWWLGREAFGGRAAWVVVAVVALSATHVRMSQDARVYAVLFLVTVLAMFAAHRLVAALHGGGRGRGAAVALGGAMAAGIWLHPTAGIIALSLNAFVLAASPWRGTGRARAVGLLALANLVAVVVAAPPIAAVLGHIGLAGGYVDRWIDPPSVLETSRVFIRTTVGPHLGSFSLAALGLQLVLLGVAARAWWRGGAPLLIGLAGMLVAGGVLMPLVSQYRPVLLDRTALFLLAPLALLLGAGAAQLSRMAAMGVVIPLLVLGGVGVAAWHLQENRKERWDLVAGLVAEREQPIQALLLPEGVFPGISLAWHLGRIGAPVPRMVILAPTSEMERLVARELGKGRVVEPEGLCGALGGEGVAWLVLRRLPPVVAEDAGFTRRVQARAALTAAGGRLIESLETPGIDLERWDVPHC
jgi:mannosyltransferase